MNDMQIEESTEHELKISVRLKGKLAEQVIKRTEQDGIYDNKGEYIRDLVHKDMNAEPTLDDQHAFPSIAEWRLSTLPRYLKPSKVKRAIDPCDHSTASGVQQKLMKRENSHLVD